MTSNEPRLLDELNLQLKWITCIEPTKQMNIRKLISQFICESSCELMKLEVKIQVKKDAGLALTCKILTCFLKSSTCLVVGLSVISRWSSSRMASYIMFRSCWVQVYQRLEYLSALELKKGNCFRKVFGTFSLRSAFSFFTSATCCSRSLPKVVSIRCNSWWSSEMIFSLAVKEASRLLLASSSSLQLTRTS